MFEFTREEVFACKRKKTRSWYNMFSIVVIIFYQLQTNFGFILTRGEVHTTNMPPYATNEGMLQKFLQIVEVIVEIPRNQAL